MISLTVGLPLFRAKHIAWLAFESLCRQQEVSFEWELVIEEEIDPKYLPFGKTVIYEYEERLKKAGCSRIDYLGTKKWKPLFRKWKSIAERSSNSLGFILQAADCYSSPYRLKETNKLFESGSDWVHSPVHLLYNILDEKVVFLKHDPNDHPCGSEMAIKTSLIKKIPDKDIKVSVDYNIYVYCESIKGEKLIASYDPTDNWMKSLNVNGLNNISTRETSQFAAEGEKYDLDKYIPSDILERLRSLKPMVDGWQRLHQIKI